MKTTFHLIYLCIFLLYGNAIQGQGKIAFDIGLSLNATDRNVIDGNGGVINIEDVFAQRLGIGLHTRMMTQSKGAVNLSFGLGVRANTVKEGVGSAFTITDRFVFVPINVHFKMFNKFKINLGASYDLLLNSVSVYKNSSYSHRQFNLSRHRIIPRLGLSYNFNVGLEMNISYHLGLQEVGALELVDIDGNPYGAVNFKEQYIQMAVFYRLGGKAK